MAFEPSIDGSLSGEDQEFIQRLVDEGRFGSGAEVVRESLRLLRSWEQFETDNRENIRAKVEEGWQAAQRGELVDGEQVMAQWRARIADAKSRTRPSA